MASSSNWWLLSWNETKNDPSAKVPVSFLDNWKHKMIFLDLRGVKGVSPTGASSWQLWQTPTNPGCFWREEEKTVTFVFVAKLRGPLTRNAHLLIPLSVKRMHYRKKKPGLNYEQIFVHEHSEAGAEQSPYLSAICGMMKCWPLLWSATQAEPQHEKNNNSHEHRSSLDGCGYTPGRLPQR